MLLMEVRSCNMLLMEAYPVLCCIALENKSGKAHKHFRASVQHINWFNKIFLSRIFVGWMIPSIIPVFHIIMESSYY
jgi:hypothetical protein